MKREQPFSMRLRADLKAALKRLADRENRSLTNYVETVLQEHVEREKRETRRK
jgi:hypothetical protein